MQNVTQSSPVNYAGKIKVMIIFIIYMIITELGLGSNFGGWTTICFLYYVISNGIGLIVLKLRIRWL